MPYEIRKTDRCQGSKPYGVYNKQTQRLHGCHPTRKAAIEQMRALYAQEGATMPDQEVLRATASRAEVQGDSLIRGIASTIGNVDRMRRVFLPGAFGIKPFRVPLLAFHDERRPVGSSLMTPEGTVLRHESQLANIPEAEQIRELIRAGGIPATSIGWLPGGYYGWRALEAAQPLLAKQSAAAGVPQREDVIYFDKAEIVENSLVPIPANPMALIAVASMLPSEERAMVQDMVEMAAGQRHSSRDQQMVQDAHDLMTRLGATCVSGAAFQWTTPAQVTSNGYTVSGSANPTPSTEQAAVSAVGDLALAVDDAIDEALDELAQGNTEELRSALRAADSSMDDLMEALNIPDPDEDEARQRWLEQAATWDTAYVNDLPDSAFLFIEAGGKKDGEGKTMPRNLRHFPYKDSSGKVDLPHLRNALARIPQSSLSDNVKARVVAKARRIAKQNGVDIGADDNQQSSASIEETALSAVEDDLAELLGRLT